MTISTDLDLVKAPTLLERTREGIKKTEKLIQARDALARLRKNKDFKLVFDELYFQNHLSELAQSLAVINSADALAGAHRAIAGIGTTKYFLDCIENNADTLQAHLDELKEMEEAILAGKIDADGHYIEEESESVGSEVIEV